MERKLLDRFNILQEMATGCVDEDEMSAEEYAETYKSKADYLKEAKYWLSMYEGIGLGIGCIHAEEKYDDNPRVRQNYRNEVAKIKRFIKRLEKEA